MGWIMLIGLLLPALVVLASVLVGARADEAMGDREEG